MQCGTVNEGYKVIVCFYADGETNYYHSMVANAITSLLANTLIPDVGLLVPSDTIKNDIQLRIPQIYSPRLNFRNISSQPHFASWNPTQYKLDIALFADEYDYVFWMDADTITISNFDFFFRECLKPTHKFWFIEDHAMGDRKFCKNWEQIFHVAPFIPQACFMGFSSSMIKAFFEIWKNKWHQWIFPYPFFSIPDPRPHFSGSEFCIEQYALGNSIQQFERDHFFSRKDIFLIPRTTLPLLINEESIQKLNASYLENTELFTSYSSCYFEESLVSTLPHEESHSILSGSPDTLTVNGNETTRVFVDNILYGSVVHTFGVNYNVVHDLFFTGTTTISPLLRQQILDDFQLKRELRLSRHLTNLFLEDQHKDYTLYFQQGSSLKVHRQILEILCPKLLEDSSNLNASSTFTIFLKSIYLCAIGDLITLTNITELLVLAIQYESPHLVQFLKLRLWNLTNGDFALFSQHCSELPKEKVCEVAKVVSTPVNLFEALYESKENTGDYTIILKPDVTIKVHQLALSKWRFFNEVITPLKFRYEDQVSSETYQHLIKYYYTEDVRVLTIEDCRTILEASDYLLIDFDLRNYCFHFTQSQ